MNVFSASGEGQAAFAASALTDEKGRYRVKGLRKTGDDGGTILDYVVTASAEGYPIQSRNGKKVGDSVDFTLIRGAANRISGTIQDAGGNPADGKEFEINVFEANGAFAAFSRSVCAGGCAFGWSPGRLPTRRTSVTTTSSTRRRPTSLRSGICTTVGPQNSEPPPAAN